MKSNSFNIYRTKTVYSTIFLLLIFLLYSDILSIENVSIQASNSDPLIFSSTDSLKSIEFLNRIIEENL